MASWENDLVESANRLGRLRAVEQGPVSARLKADIAAEFCMRYRNLLFDRSFGQTIREIAEVSLPAAKPAGESRAKPDLARTSRVLQRPALATPVAADEELRAHVARAMYLLLEAGVDGEVAMEAIRKAEEALERGVPVTQLIADDLLRNIQDARRRVCALAQELAEEAATAEQWVKIKGAGVALVGLALVGAAAAPIATTALATAGTAIMAAIGGLIFNEGYDQLKKAKQA